MPVGRWVIRTAESVVLTLCPPGPGRAVDVDPQLVLRDVDVVGLLDHRHHLDAGEAGLPAALVVERADPHQPVGARLDAESVPYAYGAFTAKVADLSPASSAYEVS